jgi:hypothetical protein
LPVNLKDVDLIYRAAGIVKYQDIPDIALKSAI